MWKPGGQYDGDTTDWAIWSNFPVSWAESIQNGILTFPQRVIQSINPAAKIIQDDQRLRPGKSEVKRLLGSNEKIMKLTQWKPSFTIDEGLKQTIDWFSKTENLKLYKHQLYNI